MRLGKGVEQPRLGKAQPSILGWDQTSAHKKALALCYFLVGLFPYGPLRRRKVAGPRQNLEILGLVQVLS